MKIRYLVALILLILPFTFGNEKNPTQQENIQMDVLFCPRENCSFFMQKVFDVANKSIHCAFFDLDLKNIEDKLFLKSDTIDVKVVIDGDNFVDLGNFAKKETRSAYMHNKFCITDGEYVLTGSMNPTNNGANKNNNNLVIIKSKSVSEIFENEFEELWKGEFGKGQKNDKIIVKDNESFVEIFFCPEDNCRNAVKNALYQAQHSIYFMTFSFTDGGIATDLILKEKEGIDVKGIFEKRQSSKYSAFELMKYNGINIKYDINPNNMHHKVFIVDDETVITGSFNPSKNANERNDENIVIIKNNKIAKKFLDEFIFLWNKTQS